MCEYIDINFDIWLGKTDESGTNHRWKSCQGAKGNGICVCAPFAECDWENIFKDSPDPLISSRQNSMVHVNNHYQSRCYFWVPELFYHHLMKHVPCPKCGTNGNVVRIGWCKKVYNSILITSICQNLIIIYSQEKYLISEETIMLSLRDIVARMKLVRKWSLMDIMRNPWNICL